MKVTFVPAQKVVEEAPIFTLAVKIGLTVTVIELEVAGEPIKQGLAFELITTEIAPLFVNAELEKVEAV